MPIGGGRNNWDFESINPGKYPEISRLRCIDGYTWSEGGNREVYKRTDIGKWENHSIQIREKPADYSEEYPGFSDIDGFNNNDIYAVGGRGDIWHYQGSNGLNVTFPRKSGCMLYAAVMITMFILEAKKAFEKK